MSIVCSHTDAFSGLAVDARKPPQKLSISSHEVSLEFEPVQRGAPYRNAGESVRHDCRWLYCKLLECGGEQVHRLVWREVFERHRRWHESACRETCAVPAQNLRLFGEQWIAAAVATPNLDMAVRRLRGRHPIQRRSDRPRDAILLGVVRQRIRRGDVCIDKAARDDAVIPDAAVCAGP